MGRTKKKNQLISKSLPELNIELGRPILRIGLTRLSNGIETFKRQKIKVIKVIHGYGSSGEGGILRTGIRRELQKYLRSDFIKDFILGEDFRADNRIITHYLESYPYMTSDHDFGKENIGITIVIIK